jgi:hypothetical protein
MYSERAKKICEIFPLLLTLCTAVKSKGKISQNFVAFSEYMMPAEKFRCSMEFGGKAGTTSPAPDFHERFKKTENNFPCLYCESKDLDLTFEQIEIDFK